MGDVIISGAQTTKIIKDLPKPLQPLLNNVFDLNGSDVCLSVKCVQLQCAKICVNELYIVDIDLNEHLPIFIDITHILEYCGLWILCGLLCTTDYYAAETDSYVIQLHDTYIALNATELKVSIPITQVKFYGNRQATLRYRVV